MRQFLGIFLLVVLVLGVGGLVAYLRYNQPERILERRRERHIAEYRRRMADKDADTPDG